MNHLRCRPATRATQLGHLARSVSTFSGVQQLVRVPSLKSSNGQRALYFGNSQCCESVVGTAALVSPSFLGFALGST
eukprot:3706734-Pleurochrysis_carterae.AAC.3